MSAPKWPQPAAVIEGLLAQPQGFEFFQAVRVLQHWLADGQGLAPEAVVAQRLRFRNSVTLAFPPGEIESLSVQRRAGEGKAGADAARDIDRITVTPAFMGLLGTQGALPHHYTEQIAQHELVHRDPSARAFLDIFTNRMVGLFHQAWLKNRLHLQYEADREQRFLPLVLSLAGLGQASLRQRLDAAGGGVDDESVAYFAAAVQGRRMPAVQLQQLLSGYLRVPVRVDSFVGRWYALPPEQAGTLLGSRGALGRDALVGERVWQRDLGVRVVLGPLDRQRYLRFLPGAAGERALRHWVRLLVGVSLDVQVQLLLRREAVAPTVLDADPAAGRLGWDSFLSTEPETTDRDDVVYDLTLH